MMPSTRRRQRNFDNDNRSSISSPFLADGLSPLQNDCATDSTFANKEAEFRCYWDGQNAYRPRRQFHLQFRTLQCRISAMVLLILCSILQICSAREHSEYLDENSVVLITGAAGFIGSELAMALHRTYNVKKILCVDSMESNFTMARRARNREQKGEASSRIDDDFALFELKRQRVFHVLQTLGKKGHFYRVDFRPSIPDYYDIGEVPILNDIIVKHPDITHLVHLADPYHHGPIEESGRGDPLTQAVPRFKEQTKTGMIEVLLEQLLKFRKDTGRVPQFTFASSSEVYNNRLPPSDNPNPPPFREDMPITTPSTLGGAAKLIDEILTETYHSMHGIYSVGLRFFAVYGPWGLPGDPLFDMTERAVTDLSAQVMSGDAKRYAEDIRDYVYIDDAVDAIMAAMQFRPAANVPPVVINVGTGVGTSLADAARQIEAYVPRKVDSPPVRGSPKSPTTSYASTDRAEQLLGFKAKVPLEKGLLHLLAWQFDRFNPYGRLAADDIRRNVSTKGIASCLPFDKECLRGAPVYACASECAHDVICTSSMFDDVVGFTRSLTAECSTVMYTVALEDDLAFLPSARIPEGVEVEHSSVPNTRHSFCNLAFVSERSPLVQDLKGRQGMPTSTMTIEEYIKSARQKRLKETLLFHGFWTLVPVHTPSYSVGDDHLLGLLPKLSPSSFFGPHAKYAIYCDSNVLFASIPALLEEAKMQPYLSGTDGSTALLIPSRSAPTNKHTWKPEGIKAETKSRKMRDADFVQRSAYRAIRIGVDDELFVNENMALIDSSWLVHTLRNQDTQLFRCDVYGEIVQWDVDSDIPALEFIMGIHDLSSRAIVQMAGTEPWWVGDGVITVRERSNSNMMPKARRRKLGEANANYDESPNDAKDREAEEYVDLPQAANKDDDEQESRNDGEKEEEKPAENYDDEEKKEEEQENDVDALEEDKKPDDSRDQERENEGNQEAKIVPDVDVEKVIDEDKDEQKAGESPVVLAKENHDAFGAKNAKKAEKGNGHGDLDSPEAGEEAAVQPKQQDVPDKPGSDDDVDEHDSGNDAERDAVEDKSQGYGGKRAADRDVSAYDTWIGVLSSRDMHLFVRIIPSSEVGVIFINDDDM